MLHYSPRSPSSHSWTPLTLAVATAACALLTACSGSKAVVPIASAVPVLAATVERKDMPVQLQAIGTVEAYSTVSVKTQITGELTGVYFPEGKDVRKGELLFTLDRRPFEAELNKQVANLEHDIAQSKLAQLDFERNTTLLKEGVISQQQYDQARANTDELEAAVKADKAAVENARVQLLYCSVYSPINGRTGTLMIHQGNMIKANDTPFLVNINQIEPIRVAFTVPEQYLPEVKQFSDAGKLPVQAAIQGEADPAVGTLSFIDNTVDPATGTIKLKGEFPNTDHRLWPGQFVDVTLILHTQANAMVVPAQAVQSGQQGQFVFVIKPDMTVEARPVTVNRTSRNQAIIDRGLTAGERVVTDGQLRLVPGAKVSIKSELAPQPAETATGLPEKFLLSVFRRESPS